MSTDILRIDAIGLAKQLDDRPKSFALYEAVQNALDAPGVTEVEVEIGRIPNTRFVSILVKDNSPEGWKDLSHAYTMFTPSIKSGDATLRGRMNVGEKLVIALAVAGGGSVEIRTTSGHVRADKDGLKKGRSKSTEVGSIFTAELRVTHPEMLQLIEDARLLVVPDGIRLTVNGEEAAKPKIERSIEGVTLTTVKGDIDGYLRRTARKTQVDILRPIDDRPYLYEMGIPVVEIDCEWSINVHQRVPLNTERDNVTPAYLKSLLSLVLSEMASEVQDAGAAWVTTAMESPDTRPEAIEAILDERFTKKRVMFDPSDPDANRSAALNGYTVVHGRSLGKAIGRRIRDLRKVGYDLCRPAGQVMPSKTSETVVDEGGVGVQNVCATCLRPL